MYINRGTKILFDHRNDEIDVRAECASMADAEKAVSLLNKAIYLNDCKRKYTASARLIAEVESMNGFNWTEYT